MAAPLSFKPDLLFGTRVTVEQVEEGNELAPKFDASGLIPCVTTDFHSGEVLMVAVMNHEALTKTIETGQAYYYSRSRQTLWHKGATSGLVQKVVEMRIDDDVGYRSCFYRRVPVGAERTTSPALIFTEDEKIFDPKAVYGDAPNPTQL